VRCVVAGCQLELYERNSVSNTGYPPKLNASNQETSSCAWPGDINLRREGGAGLALDPIP
jgi:hypothetical protein